jgi:hypothetical protein
MIIKYWIKISYVSSSAGNKRYIQDHSAKKDKSVITFLSLEVTKIG